MKRFCIDVTDYEHEWLKAKGAELGEKPRELVASFIADLTDSSRGSLGYGREPADLWLRVHVSMVERYRKGGY